MSEARVATELEIVAVVGELSDAFPQVNVTDRTIKVYVEDLADLPIEALRLAARKCRTDSKWFPSIAELRAAALALVVGQPRSGLEAWGDVLDKVREHGYLRAPEFTDPLVARAVKAMSWREICLSEEPMVVRAHFIKAYESMAARQVELERQVPEVRAQIESHRPEALIRLAKVAQHLTITERTDP